MWRGLFFTAAATVLAAIGVAVSPAGADATCVPPMFAAHRGDKSVWTEETPPAYADAVAAGSHWLDADAHFTSDGHIVLVHDPTMHLFGSDADVSTLTQPQVAALRSSDGQRPMFLTDFTRELAVDYPTLHANVEFKVPPAAAEWTRIDAAFATVKPRVRIEESDNIAPLLAVLKAARARHYLTGVIDNHLALTPTQVRSYGSSVFEKQTAMTPQLHDEYAALTLHVFEYVENDADDWAANEPGDYVITDFPADYQKWACPSAPPVVSDSDHPEAVEPALAGA